MRWKITPLQHVAVAKIFGIHGIFGLKIHSGGVWECSNRAGRKPGFRDVAQIMKRRDKVIGQLSCRRRLTCGLTCTVDNIGLEILHWMGHGKH